VSDRETHALDAFLAATPETRGAAIDVTVERVPSCLNLRGRPTELAATVAALAGVELPLEPNRFARGDQTVYWLGPDEWLVTSDEIHLSESWREDLAGAGGTVVDLSSGYVSLLVDGIEVRGLLARGCTLDLHPSAFRPGDCAQTGLAKCAVLIARENGENAFRLIVRRSFAEYLALWLRHAGEEYGIRFRKSD